MIVEKVLCYIKNEKINYLLEIIVGKFKNF